MKYIFLDDERNPEDVFWEKYDHGEFTIVRNYDQFVNCVEQLGCDLNKYVFSFDHDLGEEKSGYDCMIRCYDEKLEKLMNKYLYESDPLMRDIQGCKYELAVNGYGDNL